MAGRRTRSGADHGLEVVEDVVDLVLHMAQLGHPPLDGGLAQIGGQRLEKLGLPIGEHLGHGPQLGPPPVQRPGHPLVEGGPELGDEGTVVGGGGRGLVQTRSWPPACHVRGAPGVGGDGSHLAALEVLERLRPALPGCS